MFVHDVRLLSDGASRFPVLLLLPAAAAALLLPPPPPARLFLLLLALSLVFLVDLPNSDEDGDEVAMEDVEVVEARGDGLPPTEEEEEELQ